MRDTLDYKVESECIEFGKLYDVPKVRLKKIMHNVVRNDGEFIPKEIQ